MVDKTIALGLVGLGVYEIHKCYTTHAPSLSDLREADGKSCDNQAMLGDADFLTGGIAIIASGFLSYLIHSPVPILLTLLVYGWISAYHHAVLNVVPN